jgi:SAM-dependent methyltransferase
LIDPTQRFSNRVEQYIRSRPHYPPGVILALRDNCNLSEDSVVADIGSGTGILTELFLENGNPVFAVEPNREMRQAGERLLRTSPRFRSIDGRAEATTLPDQSIDLVAAGQAFHWFDRRVARREFARILRPGGWVVLLWNERETASTPFLRAYEQLVGRYAVDYAQVDHRRIDQTILGEFFGAEGFGSHTFRQSQRCDLEGAQSRLASSSYMPGPGHPRYAPMLETLGEIFRANERNGSVEFKYLTRMYYGTIGPGALTSS